MHIRLQRSSFVLINALTSMENENLDVDFIPDAPADIDYVPGNPGGEDGELEEENPADPDNNSL